MSLSVTERQARLDDWEALAQAAIGLAETPLRETPPGLLREIEWASCWAWPRSSDTRCRALQATMKVMAMTPPGHERGVLAGPLKSLARSVLSAVEEARPAAPRERKDIDG